MRQTVGTLNSFLIAQGMAIVIVDFALPMHTVVLCDGGHIGQNAVVLTVIKKKNWLKHTVCLLPQNCMLTQQTTGQSTLSLSLSF
jgi:hypothetical protein